MPTPPISYAELIRLPNVLALLSATCLTRLANSMFRVVIVFYALTAFGSPTLAGWIAFAAMAPGLAISPLAGALLDRAGAARSVTVDLAVSATVALTLAIAVWLNLANPPAVILLAAAFALTSPLSAAGVRVLLPRLVPADALDRGNALDTAVYAVVDIAGPSFAGVLMGFAGALPAFLVIAAAYAAATICIGFVRSANPLPSTRPFLRQALEGLGYVLRRPLLRGLAIGYGLNMVTWGILVVAVPVLVAQWIADWETATGLLWAGVGVTSGIGALAAGQLRMLGREVRVIVACLLLTAFAVWPIGALFGLAGLGCGLAAAGLLAGPIDVGVLTLRQRRTDPVQLGRVLAISISLNTSGYPIGTALGGMLVAWSPNAAFVAAALASLLSAVLLHALIPAGEEQARGQSSF